MTNRFAVIGIWLVVLGLSGGATASAQTNRDFVNYTLSFETQVNPALQAKLEHIDASLRARYGMTTAQTAVGVLDLNTLRLAMIHPDREEYAASIPKIGILLAYFQIHPEAATNLDGETRHELGLMAKASSNEMAAKFSRELGLKPIQAVLDTYHFYDPNHGGGIWVGKHYGQSDERIGSPVGDNSHAATVRQLLRFFLLLEQGKLVSPAASKTIREIFASPDIPPDDIKFVKGLAGRDVQIIRKWGSWEDWQHDRPSSPATDGITLLSRSPNIPMETTTSWVSRRRWMMTSSVAPVAPVIDRHLPGFLVGNVPVEIKEARTLTMTIQRDSPAEAWVFRSSRTPIGQLGNVPHVVVNFDSGHHRGLDRTPLRTVLPIGQIYRVRRTLKNRELGRALQFPARHVGGTGKGPSIHHVTDQL